MQSPTTSPVTFQTAPPASGNPRLIAAIALVIALHAGLLGVAMTMRNDLPPRPIEAKAITAMLISETPQPAPQPVAVETPPPPKPVPKPEPKPIPKPIPKPKVKPKVEPKPTPMPVTEAPSQIAAPAIGKPTMDLAAPKNVAHLSCNIAQPEYPAMARRRGETGTATVRLTVGLSGKIENVTLQKSSGLSRLDDAALDAVRGSACSPYKENGEAIRATATVPFVFSLDN
ncbi:Ferric siderophore transport system, periplasmic binding protein TonB [Candidatus Burkholderia verschuerenii]|uniref:Protein TonB n=1 Tax=Candidatus Burkholderia verschuerenii TaxID=242163 RepID=A0A0L0MEH2_9BURK|nr:energy transducer TonB [Candidatus Burkholderia verschuerenii]KND60670.1 Ferric siderophore transport system, periplasmic binding protein TonB [Candidatus Burkholderia verschuerenii]